MKVFVLRNWLRTFQKAKIEINEVSELTFIEFGLVKQLKSTKDTIDWLEKRLKEGKFYEEDDNDDYYENRLNEQKEDVKLLEKMIESLEIKNQKEWKTKKPTQ